MPESTGRQTPCRYAHDRLHRKPRFFPEALFDGSSLETMQTGGVLNPVGKDLFDYVFAKDGAK